ncbi:MAG: hypothetical protein RIQ47_572, partial [Bacteroidota bacterium]
MFVPLEEMPASSRVWVFMSDREWSESEIELIRFAIRPFLDDWTAHQKALKSSYAIFYNRFLVLAVDEQFTSASGCSIDKSVNFIKSLEQQLSCNLMNRMLFAYKKDDRALVVN